MDAQAFYVLDPKRQSMGGWGGGAVDGWTGILVGPLSRDPNNEYELQLFLT